METEFNADGLPVKCHHKRVAFSFYVTTGLVATVFAIAILILVPSNDVLRVPVAGVFVAGSLFSAAMSCWLAQTKNDWLKSRISNADFDRLAYFVGQAKKRDINLPEILINDNDEIMNGALIDWCKQATATLKQFHGSRRIASKIFENAK